MVTGAMWLEVLFCFSIELLKSPSTAEEVLNFYIHKSQQQHIFMSARRWKQLNNLLAAQEVLCSFNEFKGRKKIICKERKRHPVYLCSHKHYYSGILSFETFLKKLLFLHVICLHASYGNAHQSCDIWLCKEVEVQTRMFCFSSAWNLQFRKVTPPSLHFPLALLFHPQVMRA